MHHFYVLYLRKKLPWCPSHVDKLPWCPFQIDVLSSCPCNLKAILYLPLKTALPPMVLILHPAYVFVVLTQTKKKRIGRDRENAWLRYFALLYLFFASIAFLLNFPKSSKIIFSIPSFAKFIKSSERPQASPCYPQVVGGEQDTIDSCINETEIERDEFLGKKVIRSKIKQVIIWQ